jgi:hypothetical protein
VGHRQAKDQIGSPKNFVEVIVKDHSIDCVELCRLAAWQALSQSILKRKSTYLGCKERKREIKRDRECSGGEGRRGTKL